ncbi:MAG TPA: hypothetical protein VIS49_08250 [Cyclobacteriaceae bacterium]
MKRFLFLVFLSLIACEDHPAAEGSDSIPVNIPETFTNLPDKIVGTYILDNATLNGPKFEVIVAANPETSVEYQPNSDITQLVRNIVFRGGGEVSYLSVCNEAQQAIEFKSDGKTSHVCMGSNSNAVDMGFWNTTGKNDDLLAWSIIHGKALIECEIVPYQVNSEKLSGYLVFPLPRNTHTPFLEGSNHQYRKIKIVLSKA